MYIFVKMIIGDDMEQLSRLKLLTNESAIEKLINTNVLIIGLGGVGGFAFDCIVRSGINNITIVDGDKFEITNLNRQLFSLHATLGLYKTDVCEKFGKGINPNINIKKITEFLTIENMKENSSFTSILTGLQQIFTC